MNAGEQTIPKAVAQHRTVRNLAHLQASGSSSRVLNLVALSRRYEDDLEFVSYPMFDSPILNRCLVIKHRLRRDEREQFPELPQTATKVVLPIEGRELKLGGHSVFVNEVGWIDSLQGMLGEAFQTGSPDVRRLELMADAPSLDPFILREHLNRSGFHPARQYFEISEADTERMQRFTEEQLHALVVMASGGGGQGAELHATRLARKLLASLYDPDLEALRETLRMGEAQFRESLFSWKGFLYYKWSLKEALPQITRVLAELTDTVPRGQPDPAVKSYVAGARRRIRDRVHANLKNVNATLAFYDDAYEGLTVKGDPGRFRTFLVRAPELFQSLGERLGAVNHIASFWRYRFPKDGRRSAVAWEDFSDLLLDFEDGLGRA